MKKIKNCNVNKAVFLGILKGVCMMFSFSIAPAVMFLSTGTLNAKGLLFMVVVLIPVESGVLIYNVICTVNDTIKLKKQIKSNTGIRKSLYEKILVSFQYGCIFDMMIIIDFFAKKIISAGIMTVCMLFLVAVYILSFRIELLFK